MVYTTFMVTVTDPAMANLVSGKMPEFTDVESVWGAPDDRGELANVTDGDYASFFAPNYGDGTSAARFEYDLGGLKELSTVVLMLDYEEGTSVDYTVPLAVSLEVSTDGTSFSKLTDIDPDKEVRLNLEDAPKAAKIALCVTPGFFTSTKVVEFEVYGKDAEGDGIASEIVDAITVAPTAVAAGESVMVAGQGADVQSIKVVSLQGAVLRVVNVSGSITAVPTDGLAAGTYLMVVSGEGYNKVVKFIVR